MSRRGNLYDNAKAESFMKTLKVEAVYLAACETFEDATADLPRFIDDVCNSRRLYFDIPNDGQAECLSLNSDVGLVGGKPELHVHCTLGFADGSVRGGHMLNAVVWPTLEPFLTESAVPLPKRHDPESTLDLYDFEG